MRKREFAMRMRKCDQSMRCDAITLKNLANAMQMRKLIRITSPALEQDPNVKWTTVKKRLTLGQHEEHPFQFAVFDPGGVML
jgi:hypothetical protein